jgi:hypothetical protein
VHVSYSEQLHADRWKMNDITVKRQTMKRQIMKRRMRKRKMMKRKMRKRKVRRITLLPTPAVVAAKNRGIVDDANAISHHRSMKRILKMGRRRRRRMVEMRKTTPWRGE